MQEKLENYDNPQYFNVNFSSNLFTINMYFFRKKYQNIKEAKTTDDFKNKLKGWIWENIH